MNAALLIGLFLLGPRGLLVHEGTLSDSLRSPARIAVAPDGTVLVTDTHYDHIARYDASGIFLGTWPVPEGPVGVAAHPDGRYFVSLRDSGAVGIYDAGFNFLGLLGDGNPMVSFVAPTDIDIATDTGNIYVVDGEGDRLYGFDPAGNIVLIVGIRGGGSGEFRYPSTITVDEPRGRLIVADHDNFRLQAFTTGGIFELQFGYRLKFVPGQPSAGWMPRTQGVVVDADGFVYVADALMSTVRVFSAGGAELAKVLDFGVAVGDLRTPCDLALSNDGTHLYVVSTNTSSVEVYAAPTWGGTPLPELNRRNRKPVGTNWSEYDLLFEPLGELPSSTIDGTFDRSGGGGMSPLRAYTGPHMVDGPVVCGRCHGINDLPGGHEGLYEGQTLLCTSCHAAGGQALDEPIHEADAADPYGTNPDAPDGLGVSHAWGVPAINASADSLGPAAGSPMALYLDSGDIKCATCHNQHDVFYPPYLRRSNAADGMCKECHAPRNEGPGERGTHAVGFDYPGGVGEFPADAILTDVLLKAGNVECLTCHAVHDADSGGASGGAGDGMLLRAANDDTLCQTCHTEHIGHTPGGSWQPGCRDCHDVHDPTSENLSLVARVVHNQTLDIDKPVTFSARDGANSFADGDPGAYDGICEVCHTATAYHKHDGSGGPHNAGQTCTNCHPHNAGFLPIGGSCVDCHSSPQDNGDGIPVGGRRGVVGEFPLTDAHAHYGVELGSDACVVCHDQTTHMDGNVDLVDADSGALYTFVQPTDLAGDPDVSTFCESCHDQDGATRLAEPFDPFGNGNTPPDVATRFLGSLQWNEWYGDTCFGVEGTLRPVNSHHDLSDADQALSGAKLECLNCHGAHTASATQPLADPDDPIVPWSGTENTFCLVCHAGGAGPTNPQFPSGVTGPSIALRGLDSCEYTGAPWYVDYTWTHSAHGLDSKRGWEQYSGAPEYELDCTVCHDPHGSYTPTNPLGNPYSIRDFVDGTPFDDDGSRAGWNGPPWTTFGVARPVIVPIAGLEVGWGAADGLCAVCHAEWVAAQHFHEVCVGCQTCHGHGQAWGEFDWGPGPKDDTPCPPPPSPLRDSIDPRRIPDENDGADVDAPPIHLRSILP